MEEVVKSVMFCHGKYRGVNSRSSISKRLERTRRIRRYLIARPDSKKIPSENDVKKKGFVVDPAPDVTRIPKCFQLDVTADSLLEMQLRLHHVNQCRLKQARQGEVSWMYFLVLFHM